MSKRAVRRAQRALWARYHRKSRPGWSPSTHFGDVRTPCSCPMCGNPRHHGKGEDRVTIQERRAAEAD